MKLTMRQLNTLDKHQKTHGHSKRHIEYMKRRMRAGDSFTVAHKKAQAKVGK